MRCAYRSSLLTACVTRFRFCDLALADFFPRPRVGDAVLVSRDYDLDALGDRLSVFAANARRTPDSVLRINHFAGAAGVYRAADASQHADHVVVGRIEIAVVL